MKTGLRSGFSVLEMLLFSALFTVVMIAFLTILVTVVGVNTRQTAAAEVNQQSQFLLEQLKYYIERSSLVELPQDVSTTTLKLRMRATSDDPSYFILSGGIVYLKRTDGGAQDQITSSRVTISNLSFVKRSNPPGRDSVAISFTAEYNSQNIKQKFVQSLQTAIARVSAATFDSNVVPSSTATHKLGVSGNIWSSVNDIINFSGTNVGIGVTPNAKLQVNGGDIYVDTTGNGLVLRDSAGKCWKIQPSTNGTLTTATTTSYGCPP